MADVTVVPAVPNKATWALLCKLGTKRPGSDGLVPLTVDGDIPFQIKFFIDPTIVMALLLCSRATLVASDRY